MSQINLLQQSSAKPGLALAKIAVWFLVILLLCLAGYYAWLYNQSDKLGQKITSDQEAVQNEQQKDISDPQRQELLVRQQQLQLMNKLVSSHVYWSNLFPALAAVTLKTASYTQLQIATDGTLTLTGSVPSMQDLDLYSQVFDSSDVNKNFSDLKFNSFSKAQQKNTTSINFVATLKYNPSLVKYSSSTNNSGL